MQNWETFLFNQKRYLPKLASIQWLYNTSEIKSVLSAHTSLHINESVLGQPPDFKVYYIPYFYLFIYLKVSYNNELVNSL